MTWLKLSDDFGDTSADLSDSAFRTHVEGLLWAMRRETGGALITRDLRRFAESDGWEQAVDELVKRGFWEVFDNGYLIRHHMSEQPSVETVTQRRASDSARQRHKYAKFAGSIHDRDGHKCRYCGVPDVKFHLDHVIPSSAGGLATMENLVTACVPCNLKKGAQTWTPLPISDSRRDEDGGVTRDSGLVGTGLDGTGTTRLEEKNPENDVAQRPSCSSCGKDPGGFALIAGRCRKCRFG